MAFGTEPEEFQRMGDFGVALLPYQLSFEAGHCASFNFFDAVAVLANQVVMVVTVVVADDEFVAQLAVIPRVALNEIFLFQNLDETKYGGEVAALVALVFEPRVQFGQRQGRMDVEQLFHNGGTASCQTESVFSKPEMRGSISCFH